MSTQPESSAQDLLRRLAVAEIASMEFERMMEQRFLTTTTIWIYTKLDGLLWPASRAAMALWLFFLGLLFPLLGPTVACSAVELPLVRYRLLIMGVWMLTLLSLRINLGNVWTLGVLGVSLVIAGVAALWERRTRDDHESLHELRRTTTDLPLLRARPDVRRRIELLLTAATVWRSAIGRIIMRFTSSRVWLFNRWHFDRVQRRDRAWLIELNAAITLAMSDLRQIALVERVLARLPQREPEAQLTRGAQLAQVSLLLWYRRPREALRLLDAIALPKKEEAADPGEDASVVLLRTLALLLVGRTQAASQLMESVDGLRAELGRQPAMYRMGWELRCRAATELQQEEAMRQLIVESRSLLQVEKSSLIALWLMPVYRSARRADLQDTSALIADCAQAMQFLEKRVKESGFGLPSWLRPEDAESAHPAAAPAKTLFKLFGDDMESIEDLIIGYAMVGESMRLLGQFESAVQAFDRALGLVKLEPKLEAMGRSLGGLLVLTLTALERMPEARRVLTSLLPPEESPLAEFQRALVTAAFNLTAGLVGAARESLRSAARSIDGLIGNQSLLIVAAWANAGEDDGVWNPNQGLLQNAHAYERYHCTFNLMQAALSLSQKNLEQVQLSLLDVTKALVHATPLRPTSALTATAAEPQELDQLFAVACTIALQSRTDGELQALRHDARRRALRTLRLMSLRQRQEGVRFSEIARSIQVHEAISYLRPLAHPASAGGVLSPLDEAMRELTGREMTAHRAVQSTETAAARQLAQIKLMDGWTLNALQATLAVDKAVDEALRSVAATLWFYFTSDELCWTLAHDGKLASGRCGLSNTAPIRATLQSTIAAIFDALRRGAPADEVTALRNLSEGPLREPLRRVGDFPLQILAPRELRSLPFELLSHGGAELGRRCAVTYLPAITLVRTPRRVGDATRLVYLAGAPPHSRAEGMVFRPESSLEFMDPPAADLMIAGAPLYMRPDGVMSSFLALDENLAVGKRLGLAALASFSAIAAPVLVLPQVAGETWCQDEADELSTLAAVGGARAVVRTRWPLPAEQVAVFVDALAELPTRSLDATRLADWIANTPALAALRPALEVSGPFAEPITDVVHMPALRLVN